MSDRLMFYFDTVCWPPASISELRVGNFVRIVPQGLQDSSLALMRRIVTHVDTITGYARISAPGHEPIDVPLDAFDVDRFGVFYRVPVGA